MALRASPESSPEPTAEVEPSPEAEPEVDPELVAKVVPIVVAVAIVIILLLIYLICYRKRCCTHQYIEKGDHPGDISYYHNRGYGMDEAPPDEVKTTNKSQATWVNERNGVETIPYSYTVPEKPEPEDEYEVPEPLEYGQTEETEFARNEKVSKIPPGYTPVTEEDRRRAVDSANALQD